MELELQHKGLDGFQLILDRSFHQEETLEGIVPDICPDVARVIDARGQVFLTSRDPSAGSLCVTGIVRAAVLYIPEGENCPRHIDMELPFTCKMDDPRLNGSCKIWAKSRVYGMDVRTINPRKLLLRAEIHVDLKVYAPEEQEICTSAVGGDEMGIQQRLEEREVCAVSAINEKSVSFTDVFALPPSQPQAAELLSSRVEQRNIESKVIGGKLVVKGAAELVVLYRTHEDLVVAANFDLPYSQVMELQGTGEECEVVAEVEVTGMDCKLQVGDPTAVAATVEMLIHAVAFENRTMTVLTDLYATACLLEPERKNALICSTMEQISRRASTRKFCESGIPVATVVDTALSIGRVTMERSQNGVVCRADTAVTVLFLSEDGALCSATYPMPVETVMPEETCGISGWCCREIGELFAVPVTGGMEVRFEVEFSCLSPVCAPCNYVGGVRILPMPESGEMRPSVILRALGEGESLWDVAKAYQSTMDDIASANELESGQIPAGTMLLIPRRR